MRMFFITIASSQSHFFPLISFTTTLHHNFAAKSSVGSVIGGGNGLERISR